MFRFLPEITDLVLDEREVESPGQLVLVGLDASDEVRVLAAQVVDQSTEGDLELGSGCCRSTPSRSPGVAWNRKLKIIGLGSGFAEARFFTARGRFIKTMVTETFLEFSIHCILRRSKNLVRFQVTFLIKPNQTQSMHWRQE